MFVVPVASQWSKSLQINLRLLYLLAVCAITSDIYVYIFKLSQGVFIASYMRYEAVTYTYIDL